MGTGSAPALRPDPVSRSPAHPVPRRAGTLRAPRDLAPAIWPSGGRQKFQARASAPGGRDAGRDFLPQGARSPRPGPRPGPGRRKQQGVFPARRPPASAPGARGPPRAVGGGGGHRDAEGGPRARVVCEGGCGGAGAAGRGAHAHSRS